MLVVPASLIFCIYIKVAHLMALESCHMLDLHGSAEQLRSSFTLRSFVEQKRYIIHIGIAQALGTLIHDTSASSPRAIPQLHGTQHRSSSTKFRMHSSLAFIPVASFPVIKDKSHLRFPEIQTLARTTPRLKACHPSHSREGCFMVFVLSRRLQDQVVEAIADMRASM